MDGFIYLAECGLAPNVTLNCNDRSAHVEWVASQSDCHYFCKAYWTCVSGANTHKDEVTIDNWLFHIISYVATCLIYY